MTNFILYIVLVATAAGASSLASRVRPRTCEADLKTFDSAHVMPAQLWLALHAHVILPDTADLFIYTDDAWSLTPPQRFERAFVVDETLALVARGGPPPYRFEPTEYGSWQAEVWPTSGPEAERLTRIMVDRLQFDHEDRLVAGEFMLVVPLPRVKHVGEVEEMVDHARRTLHLPLAQVRGLRTTGARQHRLYVAVDLDGGPTVRYRATLALMSAVNARLAHARLP